MSNKADIAQRMRDEARRFNRMHEAGERPWLADAAFVADELELAAAEIERLRALVRENAMQGMADELQHIEIIADRDRLRAALREYVLHECQSGGDMCGHLSRDLCLGCPARAALGDSA